VVGDLAAAAGGHVPVDGVVAGVQAAAHEPLGERELPLEDGLPGLEPVEEVAGLAGPEALVVGVGLVVERPVAHQGLGDEVGRRREGAVLDQVVLDGGALRLVGHVPSSVRGSPGAHPTRGRLRSRR
jgi:hypothetical protein